jgi:hypothetical protein
LATEAASGRSTKEGFMKKAFIATAALVAAVGLAVALSSGGSATAAGGQTLTFYEDASHEANKFIDNAPKSPSDNPGSPRFRLSLGDELAGRTPVLDSKGGSRIGTAFGNGTVMKGHSFRNAVLSGHDVVQLRDGQIMASGLVRNAEKKQTFAVTGGTGAYEGAHGSVSSIEQESGSLDTVHLLP